LAKSSSRAMARSIFSFRIRKPSIIWKSSTTSLCAPHRFRAIEPRTGLQGREFGTRAVASPLCPAWPNARLVWAA
jgi:hypothetical protein